MRLTRIRAITVGIDTEQYHLNELIEKLSDFYTVAEHDYLQNNFPIQTRRLTLSPMQPKDAAACYQIKSTIDTLSRSVDLLGVRWYCLPLKNETQLPREIEKIIANIIYSYPQLFVHFMIANNGDIANTFSFSAARIVLAVSRFSNNGYDNFRVGMGANIKPNTPYFPFSYHAGKTGFSLAVELIEQLIQTVEQCATLSLHLIRERLIETVSPVIEEIDRIGKSLELKTGFEYKGQDISIAPFPDVNRSVARLIELLGPDHCGQTGTLMITSLLTDVLKTALIQTGVRQAGFNGVMFSLLEDQRLAKANDQRYLSIEKLMLYSSVCGCGLDMIPVAGDIFEEELNGLVLDVAALSTVLHKPLGVRVLPIPMKAANELTHFNHDFLTNTRIMSVDGQRLAFPLSLEHSFRYLRFDGEKNKESIK